MFNKILINFVRIFEAEIWNNKLNRIDLAIKAIYQDNIIVFVFDNYIVASELKIYFKSKINVQVNLTQTGILYQEYHVNLHLDESYFNNITRILHKNLKFFPDGKGCSSYMIYSVDITDKNLNEFISLINEFTDESETILNQTILIDYEF